MKKLSIISLLLISQTSLAAQLSVSDSIQIVQNNTLKSICREVSQISSEIAKIDSSRFQSPINQNLPDTSMASIVNIENGNLKAEKSIFDMLYKSFGNIFSALLAGFVSLCIFYRKWKNEKEKEENLINRKIQEKNDYLKSIIVKVIELSKRYKDSIEQFTSSIKNDPYVIPEIELYPLQEFSRLQRIIENEEYYHAFLNKFSNSQEKVDNFRTIASLSDYLESQTREFLKTDYRVYDFERKTKYSNLLRDCNEDAIELGMNYHRTIPQLNIGLQKILTNYNTARNGQDLSNLAVHQEYFVIKLTKYLYQDDFFVLPEARMLLNKLSRMRDLYEEIPLQNLHTIKKFEIFQKEIENAAKRLEEEAAEIINSKTT